VIILTTRPGDGGRGAERNAAFVFLLILCIQSSRADIFRLRLLSWSAIYPSRYITCGWGARWEESNRHRHPPLSTPPFHLSPSSSIFCSQTFLPNHNPPQKPQTKPQTANHRDNVNHHDHNHTPGGLPSHIQKRWCPLVRSTGGAPPPATPPARADPRLAMHTDSVSVLRRSGPALLVGHGSVDGVLARAS